MHGVTRLTRPTPLTLRAPGGAGGRRGAALLLLLAAAPLLAGVVAALVTGRLAGRALLGQQAGAREAVVGEEFAGRAVAELVAAQPARGRLGLHHAAARLEALHPGRGGRRVRAAGALALPLVLQRGAAQLAQLDKPAGNRTLSSPVETSWGV